MSALGKITVREKGRLRSAAGDAAALAVPEVTLVPRLLGLLSRRTRWLIVGGLVVFASAVGAAILLLNGMTRSTAEHGAAQFAVALARDDARLAPSGAGPYVTGVAAYFGPVAGARVVHTANMTVGHGDEAHTFGVADVLLTARRGPAVIELAFDNGAFNSTAISSVYELRPDQVPAVSPVLQRQLTAAFAARGGHAADAATLSTAVAAPAPSAAARAGTVTRKPVKASSFADPQLRCVQQAHGDVTKLQRCAHS